MVDRQLTLMAVHAHPDDESSSTGGALAKYAAEGITTVLVTCTDGRCGDGPGAVKPGQEGHDPEAVVAMRTKELEASAAALNVTHLELLGYHDSGMMGWATNTEPGAFWNTPVEVAAERLAELMRKYRPDVVVTYDENGFYGHPDHIQAHRITMAAVDLVDGVSKVYWVTASKSQMENWGRLARESGIEWDEPDEDQPRPEFEMGLPDEQITTWIDAKDFVAQQFASLAAHASQGENIPWLRLGVEGYAEYNGPEAYLRVRDTTGAPLPEDDLFAGLR
jgi:LmbE family N-acetylglucosaminyl deacetylase